MIHLGENTSSRIISKGITAGPLQQHLPRLGLRAPQGRRRPHPRQLRLPADRQPLRRAHRTLHREPATASAAKFEHEATTSRISEDQLFYCHAARASAQEATVLLVNGFVKDVLQQLPMEFAVEAAEAHRGEPEGSVG